MKRFEDWPRRLDAAIEAARGRPFSWGRHDCVLFATAVAADLTGTDHAERYRGTYRNARGAARILLRNGGLAALVTRYFGDPVMAPEAKRGDLLLACRETGMAIGVCVGRLGAFAGPKGLSFLPLKECDQAWHI